MSVLISWPSLLKSGLFHKKRNQVFKRYQYYRTVELYFSLGIMNFAFEAGWSSAGKVRKTQTTSELFITMKHSADKKSTNPQPNPGNSPADSYKPPPYSH